MSELAKGFPAFPARKRRTRRAQTWWGNAWIESLEDSSLDSEQLGRGRAFANGGHVGTITVSPGRISATVFGPDHTPYETVVGLEQFTDDGWERLLDRIAGKTGHIAALLERDMPDGLVDTADDAGIRLLPGIDDLESRCTCDEWGHPCTHAAALCYQAAWLLDTDPFLLLLLRGRGEDDLLTELQRRNAGARPTQLSGEVTDEKLGVDQPGLEPAGRHPVGSNPAGTGPAGIDQETIDRVRREAAARAAGILAQATP